MGGKMPVGHVRRIELCVAAAILTVIASACRGPNEGQPIAPNSPKLELKIEQDGKLVPITDHRVILKKKPFAILMALGEGEGLHVNAWVDTITVEDLKLTDDLDNLIGFTYTGMAEAEFNPERALAIERDSSHYWYYRSDQDHRFSSARRSVGVVECRRVIEKVFLSSHPSPIPMEQFPHRQICLTVVKAAKFRTLDRDKATISANEGMLRVALQKEYLILQFSE